MSSHNCFLYCQNSILVRENVKVEQDRYWVEQASDLTDHLSTAECILQDRSCFLIFSPEDLWRSNKLQLSHKDYIHTNHKRVYICTHSFGVSFVVGTSNLKVETIKDHEISVGHIRSIATKRAKKAGLLEDSVADRDGYR